MAGSSCYCSLSFPIATAPCVQTYFFLVILRLQVGICFLPFSLFIDSFTCCVLQVYFWAPTFKWGINIANIVDFAKPPEKISYPQQIVEVMHFTTFSFGCSPNAKKCCTQIKKIVVSLSTFPSYRRRYSSGSPGLPSRFSSCNSHPILQSCGLQHWFKNWQELRKNKLTASTFGQAVGFWPKRRVQLWLEKIGAVEPFSGNLATCWSNIKEEEALERYKLITGNPVSFTNFSVYREMNKGDDWLAASPDGVVDKFVYHLPSRGVLEIKCPFFNGDMTDATPWKRIPIYYVPQAQGLMEILDRDWMDYYIWTTKGSSLFRLHRDEEYWQLLKIALSDFWWKHVQPAKELYKRLEIRNPLIEFGSYKPEPKHEKFQSIIYESRRVLDNSTLLMREIDGKLQN